jgi:hypothetical protein
MKPFFNVSIGPVWRLLALAGSLAGCVNTQPLDPTGRLLTTTQDQRMLDSAVQRDWAAIEALRIRIAKLQNTGTPSYAIARAQGLFDFAVAEYQENDHTGIVEPVLDDALRTVQALETGAAGMADWALPKFPAVVELRKDLWQQALLAKKDPLTLKCAGSSIARLEVALVELGHKQHEADAGLNKPDHKQPTLARVDLLAAELARAVKACDLASSRPAAAHKSFEVTS